MPSLRACNGTEKEVQNKFSKISFASPFGSLGQSGDSGTLRTID